MKQPARMVAAVLALSLLVAACSPVAAPTSTQTSQPPTAAPSPTTASPATALPTVASPQASPAATGEAAAFPTPNPKPECVAEGIPEDPNIAPVGADEWTEGPADAPVTLIEYSDFM